MAGTRNNLKVSTSGYLSDGDKGRRLGGQSRFQKLGKTPVDDSGRTHQQYWAQLGWYRMIQKYGREGASQIQSERGRRGWMKEVKEYSRYLGEMRFGPGGKFYNFDGDQVPGKGE